MTKIYDLTQGNMGELARQQHRDQYATPLNGASVGSGGTRYYGEGQLLVENEGLVVTGSAEIFGQLVGSGQLTWTGSANISGPLTVTGATSLNGTTTVGGNTTVNGEFTTNGALDVNGPTTLAGKLDITGRTDIAGDVVVDGSMTTNGPVNINGDTQVTGDMTVTGGGKIKAGGMTIDPASDAGSLLFASGAKLANYAGGGLAMQVSGAVVGITPNGASIGTAGASIITDSSFGVGIKGNTGINGKLSVSDLPTTSNQPNIYVDGSGNFFRSTA